MNPKNTSKVLAAHRLQKSGFRRTEGLSSYRASIQGDLGRLAKINDRILTDTEWLNALNILLIKWLNTQNEFFIDHTKTLLYSLLETGTLKPAELKTALLSYGEKNVR